jgi:hypothetical protein
VEGEEGAAVMHLRSTIALSLSAVVLACQPGRNAQPPNRNESLAMKASPCRAVLTPASDGLYGIRFELSNPTGHAIALDTYEPFLQFQVRAAADGAALAVDQPALDIPVQLKTLMVPAAGTIELVTPVRLRLRADVPPAQDRFLWSVPHEPKGVQLTFTLDLPPPFDQPFTTQVTSE